MSHDSGIYDDIKLNNNTNIQMAIPSDFENFTVAKVLHESSSRAILSVFNKEKYKDQKLALKCIPHNLYNSDLPEIYNRVQHPNVLPIYEFFEYPSVNPRFNVIVMPCVYPDLLNYSHYINNDHLSEMTVCLIMNGALKAVNNAHYQGVCHMDLKPDNFLIDQTTSYPKPLLIDFDYAYFIPYGQAAHGIPRGTLIYSAPELLKSSELKYKSIATFDAKVDTWSLGVMMTYLLIGVHPFWGNASDALDSIKRGILPGDSRIARLSPNAQDLICKMVCADPDKRISVEEALYHNWFIVDLENYKRDHPETLNKE